MVDRLYPACGTRLKHLIEANRGWNPFIKPCVLVFIDMHLFLSLTELLHGPAEAFHLNIPDLIGHHWCPPHAHPAPIALAQQHWPPCSSLKILIAKHHTSSTLWLYTYRKRMWWKILWLYQDCHFLRPTGKIYILSGRGEINFHK